MSRPKIKHSDPIDCYVSRPKIKHSDPIDLDNTIELIRTATNKAWVLGSERFKREIETQVNRRIEPTNRGGDRKSEKFREQAKNQTL